MTNTHRSVRWRSTLSRGFRIVHGQGSRQQSKMSVKLRVGLLLDTIFIPAWALTAIERIVGSNSADLVLMILNKAQASGDSGLQTRHPGPSHRLYHIFNTLD